MQSVSDLKSDGFLELIKYSTAQLKKEEINPQIKELFLKNNAYLLESLEISQDLISDKRVLSILYALKIGQGIFEKITSHWHLISSRIDLYARLYLIWF